MGNVMRTLNAPQREHLYRPRAPLFFPSSLGNFFALFASFAYVNIGNIHDVRHFKRIAILLGGTQDTSLPSAQSEEFPLMMFVWLRLRANPSIVPVDADGRRTRKN